MFIETRGSALIVVLLLSSLLALAGLTLATVAQQERGLSTLHARELRLERAALDALHGVVTWFELPERAPLVDQVARQRLPFDPLAPHGPPLAPVGEYKAGIDIDGNGVDDLFEPPYRGDDADSFLGHQEHPDLAIADEPFLAGWTRDLFGPAEVERAERRRVERIEISSPPIRLVQGEWQRHGVATIVATVVVERRNAAGDYRVQGRRQARGVLQEVPYESLAGPMLESCADLSVAGGWSPHWGEVRAGDDLVVEQPIASIPASLPRGIDGRLWSDDGEWVAAYQSALDSGLPIPDPWLRVTVGASVIGAPSAEVQPWPHTPPAIGSPAPWECCGHSHILQSVGALPCPQADYEGWKSLAQSAMRRVEYYEWVAADRYRASDGVVRSAQEILEAGAGEAALRFFDTADRRAPADDDSDGLLDNLTPPISIVGSPGLRGLLIAHSRHLTLRDLDNSLAVDLQVPGEPAVADGTAWIDLHWLPDRQVYPGGEPEHAQVGPTLPEWAAIEAGLIQAGDLSILGRGTLVGRIAARSVFVEVESGLSHIYPQPVLEKRGVLPQWRLPRFVIAEVDVD